MKFGACTVLALLAFAVVASAARDVPLDLSELEPVNDVLPRLLAEAVADVATPGAYGGASTKPGAYGEGLAPAEETEAVAPEAPAPSTIPTTTVDSTAAPKATSGAAAAKATLSVVAAAVVGLAML